MPHSEPGDFAVSDNPTPSFGAPMGGGTWEGMASELYSYPNAATCPDCGGGMIKLGLCCSCPLCGFGSCSG